MNVQAYAVRDEQRPPDNLLLQVIQRGLRSQPKRLPSWLFYDEQGSALFEQICEQPEYYLTRAEIALLGAHAGEIAKVLGPDVRLVEYGSGHAIKTRLLLEHLATPVAWVPIELSSAPLRLSMQRMEQHFPELPIQPLTVDFTRSLRLPVSPRVPRRTVVYFPGSTIGNFDDREAAQLLRKMRGEMGDNGGILIGVDLKKDKAIIEAAYNDRAGVTAQFTLNMLARLNRELGCNFELGGFCHRAHYNAMAGRIETHILSRHEQRVCVGRLQVLFREDEAMLVEYSYKYSLEDFAALAATAGLVVQHVWFDPDQMFSLQYLARAN
ncbi:L-histidine N(alpha)-methyltransferase [Dyella sp. M7H15-1]|uniref:L-histidine N(alpha)-methyltransferase n=1 Tax=Dyella sp. M7H15-1 TaxID=2501295 RepID=UPI0010051AE8|nr:L-histidine N(alpha)-methyltransferase [Dyella sp. M7H15-1]QAU23134.1 L-histidine N(alpha)-methyltransferase [Dyella sp. M7H15-1]